MPPLAPATGSNRFKLLRTGVMLLGVLVILGFAASSAYDAWRSYRYSIRATHREIANMAQALAEQTAWTLQAVDLLLLDTARWYRTDGQTLPPDRLSDDLKNRVAGLRGIRQMMIVDAAGDQRYGSMGDAVPHHNVADRSYFVAQQSGDGAGLYLSEPLITRTEGHAAVVLSRRLSDAEGRFAGVVSAALELDALKDYYRAVNLGGGSAVLLMREDGTLLARNPAAPQAVGRKFPMLLTPAGDPGDTLVSPIDGRTEFVALAPVRNAPLVVAVARERSVALGVWREETTRVAVRTSILTMLGILTLLALVRQLGKVAASEQALRLSEERYALAMEGANEGHWDWDVAAERIFLSAQMKKLYGRSADAPIDTRRAWLAEVVIHPEDLARFEAAIEEHFAGRTPRYECEYRVRQSDGSWRWLLARGRCLRDAQDRPLRFVGSASDITAQKHAESEREKLETQLRQSQKMEAIGTLAGGIAHDFNNILGAILGYGELALQASAAGSPLRRYLDNVMNAAERAELLVERILGFSRSGLGDRAPVNVRLVVEETLELLEASLPPDIRLERRIEATDAAVLGDATYLHQVAMNLCTNAIQAMGQGGVLRVALDCIEVGAARHLSRGSLAPGSHVRLRVGDTGAGIPADVMERIFDPFFTTKGVGEGTGLGLSLVHGIVSDLGGAIEVTSTSAEGTTFEVWLPVSGRSAAPEAQTAPVLPRGNGETVMIVDDERALVALAEEITAQLGYEPIGFDSSGKALAAFRTKPQRFDAVLTDEAMPDLSGIELAQEIRRLRPSVPIILMSGFAGAQLAERAARLGVHELLRKPLHRHELAESLARTLAVD